MAKKGGNTVELVTEIVKPIIEQLGLSLWDVRFVKEGADYFLRIFIDSENGITIEDCENVSRAVDLPLDEADPIPQSYCLEVCSPGIERELKKEEHFQAFIDSPVMVKMIRPIDAIEDCENVSRAVDLPLDEADPIPQSYCLEVCSPGIERELKKEEHFQAFIDSPVMVKMIRPIDALGKEFSGILRESDKSTVKIEIDGQSVVISKKDTVWIKLDDFDM